MRTTRKKSRMRRTVHADATFILASLSLAVFMACQTPSAAAADQPAAGDPPSLTLIEHLRAAEAPVFRPGHSLLPLTRWGWSMPLPVRIDLAERWGYALEFGGYVTHARVDELEAKPDSANARVVALAAGDPARYPLFVLTDRPLGRTAEIPEALRDAYYVRDAEGRHIPDDRTGGPSWRTVCPLAPAAIFEWAARGTVEPLLRLAEKAPLAVILNGGEYGLTVAGHSRRFWEQSPAVVEAKGERSWLDFMSVEKTRQEGIISDAVRQAFPGRLLYLWYHFAGIPSWDGPAWSNGPELLAVSDLPDQSLYYKHFNTGWDGNRDLLSNFTHALAQAIALGHPLSYNWVCGGWVRGKEKEPVHSPRDRYMGFLKSLYAAGQVGAVAGYFSSPEGLNEKPVGLEPPPHLQQMMDLGHVQALYSHVDDFLREGDLLPGPYPHARDANLPAYEFAPPGEGVRVFVRRHRKRDAWLISAWAAAGDERAVTVDVPDLGQATVTARAAGSVTIASSRQEIEHEPPVVALDLLDPDPLDPTARWRQPAAVNGKDTP